MPAKTTRKKKAEEELPFNVSGHFLVPKHELLTPDQAVTLLKNLNATADKLPLVLSTDSVVKQIGGKPGDFVRITRQSETAGEGVYYRYVVEG